jgi:hypothetical protein
MVVGILPPPPMLYVVPSAASIEAILAYLTITYNMAAVTCSNVPSSP